jgi:DNA modification methylase
VYFQELLSRAAVQSLDLKLLEHRVSESFLNDKVILLCGDCREQIALLEDNSIDSVVTDPPYSLVSIVKRFGSENAAPAQFGADGRYVRASAGFMGKQWDTGEVAFDPAFWAEVLRVLKPGAHLIAMGGDRTFHRLACAIEDAGFEIRATVAWVFGSGFPKNHDVSKRMREYFSEDDVCSCGHRGLQTVQDFPVDYSSCRHPDDELPHLLEDIGQNAFPSQGDVRVHSHGDQRKDDQAQERANTFAESKTGRPSSADCFSPAGHQSANSQSNDSMQFDKPASTSFDESMAARKTELRKLHTQRLDDDLGSSTCNVNLPRCGQCGKFVVIDGLGTALKPAMELCCLARKPLSEKTVAANVLRWGTGAINIDGCRIPGVKPQVTRGINSNATSFNVARERQLSGDPNEGRWPANIIHDGSEEVLAAFPDAGVSSGGGMKDFSKSKLFQGETSKNATDSCGFGDSGSAARFFKQVEPDNGRDGEASAERRYTDKGSTNFAALPGARRDVVSPSRLFYSSKADADDRLGSSHPTVKPLDLIQYLVRLITPPGGLCLDPFAGTGTLGEAAYREGFKAILIEREAEYQADIRRRMALVMAGPDERMRESVKHKMNGKPRDDGPLFGGTDMDDRGGAGRFTESSRTKNMTDGTEVVNE